MKNDQIFCFRLRSRQYFYYQIKPMLGSNFNANIKTHTRNQHISRQYPQRVRPGLTYPTRQHFENKLSSIDHIDRNIHELLALVKDKDGEREHRANYCQPAKNNSCQLDSFEFEQYRRRIINLQKLIQLEEETDKNIGQNNLIGNYQHKGLPKTEIFMGKNTTTEVKNILNANYSIHHSERSKLSYRAPRLMQKPRLNLKYINKSALKSAHDNGTITRSQMTPTRKKQDENMNGTTAKTTTPKNVKSTSKENQMKFMLSQSFKGIKEQSLDQSKSLDQSRKSKDNTKKININIQEIEELSKNANNRILQNSQSQNKSQQRIPYSPKQFLNQSKLEVRFDDQEDNDQISPYRQSFQLKVYPCNLNKDNIKNFIADRLLGVVKLDSEFGELKDIYIEGNLKETNLSAGEKKQYLLKVLWSRGLMVNERDVDSFLDLVPSGKPVNLQLKQKMQDFSSLSQAMVDKYLEAEFEWEKKVVGMITKSHLNSCLFKPSQVDLEGKGYLKMQDLACFINLYGQNSPCFRNKQTEALFLRFCRGDDQSDRLSYDRFTRVVCSDI